MGPEGLKGFYFNIIIIYSAQRTKWYFEWSVFFFFHITLRCMTCVVMVIVLLETR